jgi:hypothetical protein
VQSFDYNRRRRGGSYNSYLANGRQRICAPHSMDFTSSATTTNPLARLGDLLAYLKTLE